MRIKITCTEGDYHAGLIYEVPDKKARELIAADKAFEVAGDTVEVTAFADRTTLLIDTFGKMAGVDLSVGVEEIAKTTKKVKNADR